MPLFTSLYPLTRLKNTIACRHWRKRNRLSPVLIFSLSLTCSLHAQAHSALVISELKTFEVQTNAESGHVDIDSIAFVNAITADYLQHIQPNPSNEVAETDSIGIVGAEADESNAQAAVEIGNVWDRVRAGFAMPTVQGPAVKRYEKRFTKDPERLSDMIHRAEKYLFHITNAVEAHKMPMEIALLPLVESSYNPTALSRARASGLWQIMPTTGKYLGLKQNWWVDERLDILASTDAALNYLDDFHARFGEWDLALAAYNAGGGKVSRAIRRNKRAKRPTDYLHLRLPKETRDYLPKLQAIKNIVTQPERYGIDLKPINDAPYFTSVAIPKQIDKILLTELAEISPDELAALNPHVKRPLITSQSVPSIQLPIDAADRFLENLSSYDKPLVSWQAYTLPAGERLSRVAKNFAIPAKKLGKINQISTHSRARKPVTILVPNQSALKARETTKQTAIPADTLSAQQQAHNISEKKLKSLDNNNKRIAQAFQRTYLVRRGDTLSGIAHRYRLSWKKLQRLNHLKNRILKAGQRIKLY